MNSGLRGPASSRGSNVPGGRAAFGWGHRPETEHNSSHSIRTHGFLRRGHAVVDYDDWIPYGCSRTPIALAVRRLVVVTRLPATDWLWQEFCGLRWTTGNTPDVAR